MGIWALGSQWLSLAIELILRNHGTFHEWSLSTHSSVTETLVKLTNQRRHILCPESFLPAGEGIAFVS